MAARLLHQPTGLWGIFCFISLTAIIGMSGAATVSDKGRISPCSPPCTEYGIVVTAQIERINLKIYKVHRRAKDAIAEVSDVRQVTASPSQWKVNISAIFYKPATFDPIFKALVQSARRAIPAKKQFSTPFFFLVLQSEVGIYSEAFKTMAKKVTDFLNDLKNNPFLPPSLRSIRVISGKSEVLFKWLTVNFLAGYFDPEKSHSKVGVLSLSSNTVTQIAYPVHSISMNVSQFVVSGVTPYLLIAQSYTPYGFGTTLRKYFTRLGEIEGQQTSPCSPRGVREQVVDGDVSKQYVGDGNIQKCREILSDVVLNDYGRWTRSPYVRKPPKHIKFYALPEVIKVLRDIGCSGCGKVFTPAKINKAARTYCTNSQSQKLARPQAAPPSIRNCLNANFFYVMLKSSYHLDDNTQITILPKSVHGIEEDWALGALLYKLRLMTYEKLP